MGIVAISFGSPTSGQGFDVSSTVSQMVTNLQAIETPWNTQLSLLDSQDTAVSTIGNDISTLSNALESLTDFEGVLSGKLGSSSDENVLQITSAASDSVAGTHTVVVTNVAQTSAYVSSSLASGDTLSGNLSVTVNGTTQTIDADGDTLSTLATAINQGDYGFSANVITGSSGTSQLSLISGTSGVAGDLTVDSSGLTDSTTSSAVSFTQSQSGVDAQLTVDGVPVTSSSNTVTDAIQGVTIQLLSPSAANETVQVEITNDNSAVESAVTTFVSAYNTVLSDLNTQEGDDASGNPEPLYGNSLTATLQEDLEQALDFTQTSGAVTSITQLGISVNDDGSLSLDTDTLNSTLNSNYSDVINFFEPSASFTSFGGNFSNILNNVGDTAPNGLLYGFEQQNSTEESNLNTEISNENATISAEQSQLTTELNEANYTLTEIPQQLDNINEIYSAITGYNENGDQ